MRYETERTQVNAANAETMCVPILTRRKKSTRKPNRPHKTEPTIMGTICGSRRKTEGCGYERITITGRAAVYAGTGEILVERIEK